MATNRQLVSDIKQSFKWTSGDLIASDRWVLSELRKASIKLIKQQTDKRKLLSSDNIFTTIPCLKMIEVPISECCDFNSFPCTISRSKSKIPNISEGIYGPICQGVFDINNTVKFDYMDPERYTRYLKLYGKNATKNKVWWKQNGYIYTNLPDLELIKIIAFFEDDITSNISDCSEPEDCPLNPLDKEFKCPGYLLDDLKKIVRDTIRQTYKSSVQDLETNDVDETK